MLVALAAALAVAATISACSSESGAGRDSEPSESASAAASSASGTSSSSTEAAPALDSGELIVFERQAPGSEEPDLYVVGADGGEPTLLRSPGRYGHWSPDGTRLVFMACLNPPDCTTGVALLERSTGEVHGHGMPDPDLFTACAIWAPSGRELGCEGVSEDDPARSGVYTVRASDGRGLTRLTRNPGGDDIPLAFSPDGSRVLFNRVDPSRSRPLNQALFVAGIGGGRPHRITPWGYTDDFASWSPDGRTIVFGTDGSLYRVGPDGRGLVEISLRPTAGASTEQAFDVSFSPDGRRIVFSLGGAEPGIYTARPDGSDVVRLTASPTEDHHANWGVAPAT